VACVPQEGGIGKEKRGHALFRKMHFQPKFGLKMGLSRALVCLCQGVGLEFKFSSLFICADRNPDMLDLFARA
jgi:hypothetical protein